MSSIVCLVILVVGAVGLLRQGVNMVYAPERAVSLLRALGGLLVVEERGSRERNSSARSRGGGWSVRIFPASCLTLEVTSNITLLGVTPPLCEKGLRGCFWGGPPEASRMSRGHPGDILWAAPGMSQPVASFSFYPGDIWQ